MDDIQYPTFTIVVPSQKHPLTVAMIGLGNAEVSSEKPLNIHGMTTTCDEWQFYKDDDTGKWTGNALPEDVWYEGSLQNISALFAPLRLEIIAAITAYLDENPALLRTAAIAEIEAALQHEAESLKRTSQMRDEEYERHQNQLEQITRTEKAIGQRVDALLKQLDPLKKGE